MMKRILLAGILLAVAAEAEPVNELATGNDFLSRCQSAAEDSTPDDPYDAIYCLGFIHGIAATLDDPLVGGKRICIPDGANNGQMLSIAIKSVEDNPDARHFPAVVHVADALMEAFPCNPGTEG